MRWLRSATIRGCQVSRSSAPESAGLEDTWLEGPENTGLEKTGLEKIWREEDWVEKIWLASAVAQSTSRSWTSPRRSCTAFRSLLQALCSAGRKFSTM